MFSSKSTSSFDSCLQRDAKSCLHAKHMIPFGTVFNNTYSVTNGSNVFTQFEKTWTCLSKYIKAWTQLSKYKKAWTWLSPMDLVVPIYKDLMSHWDPVYVSCINHIVYPLRTSSIIYSKTNCHSITFSCTLYKVQIRTMQLLMLHQMFYYLPLSLRLSWYRSYSVE